MLPCVILLSDNVPIKLHVCTWQNIVVHSYHWQTQPIELIPVFLWYCLACPPSLACFFFSDLCSAFNAHISFCSPAIYPNLIKRKRGGPMDTSSYLWLAWLISVTSHTCALARIHSVTMPASSAGHG